MSGFSIGLSGLRVAQRAIEIISTNITNAATEGYHRQEPMIRSIVLQTFSNSELGGAEVTEIRRNINSLLELEIMRQQSRLGQAEEEIDILSMIETAFGEVGNNDLASSLDQFFNSLAEFASDPAGMAFRTQVVWTPTPWLGSFAVSASSCRIWKTRLSGRRRNTPHE